MDENEKSILEDFRNPDTRESAFGRLVKTYQERVYWHIRRMVISHDDADDVLQNVFIKVWKSLDNFRGDSGLFTWLYRIATNESITFLKQKRGHLYVNFDDVAYGLSDTLESDPYFRGDAIQKKLQNAILTLPDKQRVVFNMKYFEEMDYQSMSEVLETSVGALKASYHHAVKKIEAYMKSA